MTLLLELVAVVLVKRMVDPAQTLIVPLEGVGIVVKLVLVATGVWPNKVPAKKIAKQIKNKMFLCNLPLIRESACNQIYGGLTDKKNKCCRTKGIPYSTLFYLFLKASVNIDFKCSNLSFRQ